MRLLSVVSRERLSAVLARVLDESQFLSDYGVRSLSRAHLADPYRFDAAGEEYVVRSCPANRTTGCSAATPTGEGRSGFR
jgi:hypothetical protein